MSQLTSKTLFKDFTLIWIDGAHSSKVPLYSYKNKNGLDQLHIGRKPFFESIVPSPLELHRTLFQQISSESALDWRTLGIQPGDQRLHKAKISEIWSGHEVALDVIPVFVNSERRNYAVATFCIVIIRFTLLVTN